ncbi:NADP-dependent malic enzyme [Sedimentibacter hydroxybenzoicus DSM 7310]|uniref:NADP-dependent malic enzyme n=1 Tax=Sedimentibacter hydroxybenzoicus DSM 7310 TaxID=1123245 RepID=A0A974BIC7_SEDHY|nr:NADP-dependent malic enzyme [Sedimentibacter hydroxybenzoicus]NYB73662.1 NADP-dependent malic enzyme [Sedimentibacter hydroxybenzoicus DSM 7310]
MNYFEESLKLHEKSKGKIEVISKIKVETREDLSLAYTPGVAEPCRKIHQNEDDVYKYTSKGNIVAVVTDGTAVLGLGDIGPKAALPVMEGKSILFKEFADVDAFPICIDSKNVDDIVKTVKLIAPGLGGINLEDIGAPRCFEIEERLKKELDIPVFHDDQHGTAIVVLAGLINALKIVNKKIEDIKIIINGAGAAGTAIANLLTAAGAKNIIACDRSGALYAGMSSANEAKSELARVTNPNGEKGSLADVMNNADVFIGVSSADVVKAEMVKSMAKDAIILAMANPTPEIMPDIAISAGARVVGTGRSDFPNQINNVLVFPGVFRGALNVRAKEINLDMKIAAAYAIANYIDDDELNENNIIPSALDKGVASAVAQAIEAAARKSGVARL